MDYHPDASAEEEPQDSTDVRRGVGRELSHVALVLLAVTAVLWWVIATGTYAPAPLLLPVWGAAGFVVDHLPTWRVL
jgi:hypothetical protein